MMMHIHFCIYVSAWFWGDPHITTLDGRVYTFNGWGEYTLLSIDTEESSFRLQGRTQPVVNSSATQFSAFAFGVPSTSVVEVIIVVTLHYLLFDNQNINIIHTIAYR